jgi:hypothetical protein
MMYILDKALDWGWAVAMAATTFAFSYVRDTRNKLEEHQLHVSENYVKKDDLKETKEEILQRLDLVLQVVQAKRK